MSRQNPAMLPGAVTLWYVNKTDWPVEVKSMSGCLYNSNITTAQLTSFNNNKGDRGQNQQHVNR